MPFGIKNALAQFQRMMDTRILEEILEGWMVVYIDEIIIYSEKWEDHVHYIDIFLGECTPINLKISLNYWNIGQKELLELGNKVARISLPIDHNKVEEALQKPVRKNYKEIQSLLGFSRYYRNQIKNVSQITSSLYKICSEDLFLEITRKGGMHIRGLNMNSPMHLS
ncbi:hypothetical protein O181_027314 [Austropuccinia psidii MF-1]|uniref:Reverse transcriptase domain-containing protein n=1 Tax=Austropuccinia psidii MF-1 TaxID=1389203 RepID=A0A9Q3H2H9_9BASI|nr:hypothetical protein [Austropuccinia psidii MF-1]